MASCRKERVRCAIYTRKSSDEGLEQGSSIRCRRSARPASQGHQGGVCLSQGYNDGGFSGATTDRPDPQRLLADITAGSRTRDKIRGIVADLITDGAVLE